MMTVLTLGKGKKPASKGKSTIKRYPSDNSLAAPGRMPPINQRDPPAYHSSYQQSQSWLDDQQLNVDINLNVGYPKEHQQMIHHPHPHPHPQTFGSPILQHRPSPVGSQYYPSNQYDTGGQYSGMSSGSSYHYTSRRQQTKPPNNPHPGYDYSGYHQSDYRPDDNQGEVGNTYSFSTPHVAVLFNQ